MKKIKKESYILAIMDNLSKVYIKGSYQYKTLEKGLLKLSWAELNALAVLVVTSVE